MFPLVYPGVRNSVLSYPCWTTDFNQKFAGSKKTTVDILIIPFVSIHLWSTLEFNISWTVNMLLLSLVFTSASVQKKLLNSAQSYGLQKLFLWNFLCCFWPTSIQCNRTLNSDIDKLFHRLSVMLETPSLFCPLNSSTMFATNLSRFNVNWMLHQIDHEVSEAQRLSNHL